MCVCVFTAFETIVPGIRFAMIFELTRAAEKKESENEKQKKEHKKKHKKRKKSKSNKIEAGNEDTIKEDFDKTVIEAAAY